MKKLTLLFICLLTRILVFAQPYPNDLGIVSINSPVGYQTTGSASVNGDGHVNSIDALMVLQRFSWILFSFPNGAWVSDQPFVVIPPVQYGSNNLKVLCTGDVNGSFVP